MTSRHLETILSLAYQVWYFPIFVDLFMSISYCIWYHLIWEKSYIDYRTSDSYFSDLDVTVFHYIYQFLTMETTHEYTRYHTTTVYTNIRHLRSLYIYILFVQFQCWSFLESYLQLHVRWQFNMIEAFANESETANIDNENPTALLRQASLANDTDQTEVTCRTSHISHFSPTGKTEAGLFRLHQQHTHLDILERRLTFKTTNRATQLAYFV